MRIQELADVKSASESGLTFAVTAFLIVAVGNFCIDPTGELPPLYKQVLEEPLAILLPFYLASFGFLLSFFCTKLGTAPVPSCPFLRWLIKAPTRAGVVGLAIASGATFGLAMGLLLWSGHYGVLFKPAIKGIVLSFLLALILCGVLLAHSFNFRVHGVSSKNLTVSVGGYTLASVFVFVVGLLLGGQELIEAVSVPLGMAIGFCCWLLGGDPTKNAKSRI